MTILRTDGSGSFENDKRLTKLREILIHFELEDKIDFLHDHKGLLTVNWVEIPTVGDLIIANRAWSGFYEYTIEHNYDGMNIFVNTKEFDR